MPQKFDQSNAVQDTFVAGVLTTAPAWAAWLGTLNTVLTTLSLILGLGLGLTRIVLFIQRHWPRPNTRSRSNTK